MSKTKPKISQKLQAKGVDLRFLAWLEGPEERLPRIDRVCKVSGEKLAAAIRAASWLRSRFDDPELIAPSPPQEWRQRYQMIEGFLVGALRYSMTCSSSSRASELAALEEVLKELLPPQNVRVYERDIQLLRRRGQPEQIIRRPGSRRRPSGGRRESEETQRMKAAIEYLKEYSRQPYPDLADFWNAVQDKREYLPDEIRNRIRKGVESRRSDLLPFWREIYKGNLGPAFPGPFPFTPPG